MTAVQIKSMEPIWSIEQLHLDPISAGIVDFCRIMSAECWCGYVGDKLICCWGLIPPSLLSTQAYLWMHSTPAVRDHQFLLVRHSQRIIEDALRRYDTIIGDCFLSASDSIRWLRWLGAEFGEPTGVLIPFVIKKAKHG